ncbi:hypothetical protein ABKA04_009022 [Annulohypoxylon sp. FPYF3050]
MTTMASESPNEEPTMATFSSVPHAEVNAENINDENGPLAVRALTSGPVSNQTSHDVRRKVDRFILPALCITYAILFIGRTLMNYCAVHGLLPDNTLSGKEYLWTVYMFYVGASIIGWSVTLMLTAACSFFENLAFARFSLGLIESMVSPALVAVTGIWWTRQEQDSRLALWFSFSGVGGFLGTLWTSGYAQDQIHGGHWKFIVELGAVTVPWGFLCLSMMPDCAASFKWLNENEKVAAIQRVMVNQTGTRSPPFVKAQLIEAFTDIRVILLGCISFTNAMSASGFTFYPLIIEGLGFDIEKAVFLCLPLFVIQVAAQIGSGYLVSHNHRFRHFRLHFASLAMVPPVCAILVNELAPTNRIGRLFGVWLLGTSPVGFMVVLGMLSTNIAGTTKRSAAAAWVFICYCGGQLLGSQGFFSHQAPAYRSGFHCLIFSFAFNIFQNQLLRFFYVLENSRRYRAMHGRSAEELEEMKKQSEIQGFEGVTDKNNAMFIYVV